MDWQMDIQPVGTVRSCFPCKNGTPRQSTIASNARGQLKFNKDIYNNPEHALEGLEEFSHVWLIFAFHKNKCGRFTKAKVSPPRLNGGKMGVFATRSPYRLNPIGLSLVKLESIEGDTLYFSGHDLVDGTPVLDIKPYIREYDCPIDRPETRPVHPAGDSPPSGDAAERGAAIGDHPTETLQSPESNEACKLLDDGLDSPPRCGDNTCRPRKERGAVSEARTEKGLNPRRTDPRPAERQAGARSPGLPKRQSAGGLQERSPVDKSVHDPRIASPTSAGDPPIRGDVSSEKETSDTWLTRLRPEQWTVRFTAWAESQLERFSASESAGPYRLRWLRDAGELRGALEQLLTADPRSVYRRTQNDQLLYHLALDASHITCWFDPSRRVIEVLRLQPLAESPLASVAIRASAESSGDTLGETTLAKESSGDPS